jgi:hypothetical protein
MASQENDSAGAKLIKTPLDSRRHRQRVTPAPRRTPLFSTINCVCAVIGFRLSLTRICIENFWDLKSHLENGENGAVLKGCCMFCVAESERGAGITEAGASLCFLGFMTPGDEQKMRDLSEVVTPSVLPLQTHSQTHTPMDPCTIRLLLLCAFASMAH